MWSTWEVVLAIFLSPFVLYVFFYLILCFVDLRERFFPQAAGKDLDPAAAEFLRERQEMATKIAAKNRAVVDAHGSAPPATGEEVNRGRSPADNHSASRQCVDQRR